jgi:ABC-type lipoprotein release transport system permease subunit
VVAQVVAERTQEVGVRMALGARPSQILAHFLRQGMRAGALGLVAGVAATAYVAKWVGGLLYHVQVFDTPVIASAAASMIVVLLAAVWWPSRRAARVDPGSALRHE